MKVSIFNFQILAAKTMGIKNWSDMFERSKDTMTMYGEILVGSQGKGDKYFDSLEECVSEAQKEHGSKVHTFIRTLSHVLEVDDAYVNFVDCQRVNQDAGNEFANGAQMPMCILSMRNTEIANKTEYCVMIQGRRLYASSSLGKTYHVFFLLQNVLFVESGAGVKSIKSLVAAINLICYGIRYAKNPLGRAYYKLMSKLNQRRDELQARDAMGVI